MTRVTAAIIRQSDRILICQRGEGGNCAFLWEFPGGKLEPDETLEECLVRECKEELDIDVALDGFYRETRYRYPDNEIILTFFNARITGGRVLTKVHMDYRWVKPAELCEYPFCPADVEVVESLARNLIVKN